MAIDHIFWVNYNELTTSSLEIIVSKGNHPQMAKLFRLVNYYNLPRYLGDIIHRGIPINQPVEWNDSAGCWFHITQIRQHQLLYLLGFVRKCGIFPIIAI